jgi:exonuclease III
MKVASWNVEGLSATKQSKILTKMQQQGIICIILTETWLRHSGQIAQPRQAQWARKDVIQRELHPAAKRGGGGVSIIYDTCFFPDIDHTSFNFCRFARWFVFSSEKMVVAGVYLNPSLSPDIFKVSLFALKHCIVKRNVGKRPLIIAGDFNARLGPITGDRMSNARHEAMLTFTTEMKLTLLNASLKHSPDRFTYISESGQSIPDLALTFQCRHSALSVVAPPAPTPHQLLLITLPDADRPPAHDPDRWNWSRKAFAREPESSRCRVALEPVLTELAEAWRTLGDQLDSQLLLENAHDDVMMMNSAQEQVDALYTTGCSKIREALSDIACWKPATAARPLQRHRDIHWADTGTLPHSFVLSKIRSALESASDQSNDPTTVKPRLQQFEEFYEELFQAAPDTPFEAFAAARKPVSASDSIEREAFSIETLTHRISRLRWRKAIGPDNLPADLLKCVPANAAKFLRNMFQTLYAHQLTPTVWQEAFMTPIPKKGVDLTKASNWRGIALQCHLKKIYEVAIRKILRHRGLLKHHILQTGFQPKTGALDAVFVVDELTHRYEKIGKPLTSVLLDISKAYDRAARALIWRKLRSRGADQHVIGVLQSLLDRCSIVIRLDGKKSKPIRAAVGVPQGDVLSPDMFNILVDDLPIRLQQACGSRGCPSFRGTVIPCVMYADDQTLFHWDRQTLQDMLNAAQEYASEHFYHYNVAKSAVSLPLRSNWPPLTLAGAELPVTATTSLLGVKMANGKLAHGMQIYSRMEQADGALFGIQQLGTFSTPDLSLAVKAKIIAAFGRSRIEYGMAITIHRAPALEAVDRLLSKYMGRCLGAGRGNYLMLRLAGLVPAATRQAQLRLSFEQRMRNCQLLPERQLLAPTIFRTASQNADSLLSSSWKRCTLSKTAHTILKRYIADYATAAHNPASNLPSNPAPDLLQQFHRNANTAALRFTCWLQQKRSKLIGVQRQDYNRPHPVAQISGSDAIQVAQWMTNLIPGAQYPCRGCDGKYNVSRYHIVKCSDFRRLMGEDFDTEMARRQADIDNDIDNQLVEMVPQCITRHSIDAAYAKCPLPHNDQLLGPRSWRSRSLTVTPPYLDTSLQRKIASMAMAIRKMKALCCVIPDRQEKIENENAIRALNEETENNQETEKDDEEGKQTKKDDRKNSQTKGPEKTIEKDNLINEEKPPPTGRDGARTDDVQQTATSIAITITANDGTRTLEIKRRQTRPKPTTRSRKRPRFSSRAGSTPIPSWCQPPDHRPPTVISQPTITPATTGLATLPAPAQPPPTSPASTTCHPTKGSHRLPLAGASPYQLSSTPTSSLPAANSLYQRPTPPPHAQSSTLPAVTKGRSLHSTSDAGTHSSERSSNTNIPTTPPKEPPDR